MRMLLLTLSLVADLCATGEKLEIHQGYPIVQAYINGEGPFRMLLDTGNTSSAVTLQTAARLRLTHTHKTVVVTATGQRLTPANSNAHIRVGTTEASGIELQAAHLPGLRRLSDTLDGVLGQNFLSLHPYLIDYRSKRILFHSDATRQAQSMPTTFLGPSVAGRPVLNVQFAPNTPPSRLILDSGASHLLLYCTQRCPRLTEATAATHAITNAGTQRVRQGILDEATLGNFQFTRRPAAVIHADPEEGQADGLLPANWFSAVYVDAARQEIRLAR